MNGILVTDAVPGHVEERPEPVPRVLPPMVDRALLLAQFAKLQAKRMLRSPVMLIGIVWVALGVGFEVPETPYDAFAGVTNITVFIVGPLTFFAANLVATSSRRSGTDEWMPSLPMPERDRVTALLLACLGPALVALVLPLGIFWLAQAELELVRPTWQHVLSVPLTVLGAAVLGVAVSRLLPWTGAPMIVMVGLVVFNFWVAAREPFLGFYVDFAEWTSSTATPALTPGDPGWHLAYIAGYVGLAVSGAYLRSARRPWAPFLSGALFGSLVLVAGYLQLP
jgi:hypothetical protein